MIVAEFRAIPVKNKLLCVLGWILENPVCFVCIFSILFVDKTVLWMSNITPYLTP